jgi:hypothetical protein
MSAACVRPCFTCCSTRPRIHKWQLLGQNPVSTCFYKVLLEHSYAHFLKYCLWLLLSHNIDVLAFDCYNKTPEMRSSWRVISSRFPVCGWLSYCFWACGKAAHYGGSVQWSKTDHLVAREQKRKGEGAKVPQSPSRACPQWSKDSPLGPTP